MAATAGNTSSGTANNADITIAHTLGTGSNLVLVVLLALDDGVEADAVTWDSDGVNESLTQLGERDNAGDNHVEIWFLVDPSVATGSSEIFVDTPTKGQNGAGVITFLGALAPENFVSDAQGTAGIGPLSPANVGADDMVVDTLATTGGSLTVGANQTEIYNTAGGGDQHAASYQDGVDGAAMDWSQSSGSQWSYAACRIPGKPAQNPSTINQLLDCSFPVMPSRVGPFEV